MREILRKIILIAMLLGSMGIFVARNRAFVARYNPLSEYRCYIPVTYVAGTVDPHFGISQEKFVAMMQEAEQKWESALGRDVLEMKKDGRVKVNLTYDERQMTTEELRKIEGDIDSSKFKAGQSLDEYKSLSDQIEQAKKSFNVDTYRYKQSQKEYESAVARYQDELKAYNQNVEYWNSQGGATGNEYNKLVKQKEDLDQKYEFIKRQEKALEASSSDLEKKRREINILIGQANTLAEAVNKIAGKTNEKVASYNQTQKERGEFETGLYSNNHGVESIDIFQFADDKDLLAVLIHEMGHALGMDHAENQSSIMYPKLINQSADITSEDVELFQTTCVR